MEKTRPALRALASARIVAALGAALVLAAATGCSSSGTSGTSGPAKPPWAAVVGTQGEDSVGFVAVDATGNVHAAGRMDGRDLFVREYDPDGELLLDKSWSSSDFSFPSGLAVVPSGGVVISFDVGCPTSPCVGPDLGDGPVSGSALAKLDAGGGVVWALDSGPRDAQGVTPRPSYYRPIVKPNGDVVVEGEDATGSFVAELSPDGDELWRKPKGNLHGSGATLLVDGVGRVTALSMSVWSPTSSPGPDTLTQYDGSGNVVWQIEPGTGGSAASIAAAGDGAIALVQGSRIGLYRSADGALERVVDLPDVMNAFGVANAERVVVVGSTGAYPCVVPIVMSYELERNVLSATTLARGCTAPWIYAAAIGPGGDVILGGGFAVPFDFGTGTDFAPRGWDGFVLDLRGGFALRE